MLTLRKVCFITGFVSLFFLLGFTIIRKDKITALKGDLFLPVGFKLAVVVNNLSGKARHLAVNTNGDIYVKLRFPDSIGGNVALRDTNNDGKADIIQKFAN
jgi:hypothetical protein